ncbi:hypothetical protein [Rhizobium lentis]|nr:hypothetical protein [Rhizobium lentis]
MRHETLIAGDARRQFPFETNGRSAFEAAREAWLKAFPALSPAS